MTRAIATAWMLALLVQHPMAVGRFASTARVLLPGSRLPLVLAGGTSVSHAVVIGGGTIEGTQYVVPSDMQPSAVTLVASAGGMLAIKHLQIASPPAREAIAVATYEDGITFADPRTFAPLGTLATGGAPSDIASFGTSVVTTDTDGDALTVAALQPWRVGAVAGVPFGDEIAADPPLHAYFVTERQLDGKGGVARIAGSDVRSVVTGLTAEGIAIDTHRQRVYVADVNDDAVTALDARSMRVLFRIHDVPRAFSLALSADFSRLFVVSNEGRGTPFGIAGRVTEFGVTGARRVLARSAPLDFPVGVVYDRRDGTLLVTDEQANAVYVLDPRTLAQRRAPLRTCKTPWKPAIDDGSDRLFVPCAGSDEVDVFDARTLARVRGAPFRTGGYPLAVAVLRP
ncbi:MAG: YncE family protein [Candidatus Tyrphobacter sp.]